MESTAARRPPANDEGVCGMFINLFRRQRPALARLARNSNAYRQPMVAVRIIVRSRRIQHHLCSPTQPTQTAYPRWMPPSAASTTSRSRP